MKTDRTAALPPYFTQVIGSLPRPKLVLDLLARRQELGETRFHEVMDDMVRFAIRLQEQAGLDVISDGEWRRIHYVGEFLSRVGGTERVRPFHHQGETKHTDVFTSRMNPAGRIFARDADFLRAHTDRVTKFALPSPFLIAIRYWHADYSAEAYPTVQELMEHLTTLLAAEARALASAGIDIIQLDDPALTYFCDRDLMGSGESHDDRLRREWDIDTQLPQAIDCINRIGDGLQAEFHLHCCHSVYKRRADVCGDYKPILPRLRDARIDRVNLEFAYHGTGQADDLDLLPDHIDVGMGVIDVRTEQLQTLDVIMAIARSGARHLAPGRIALNPDCGFAPDASEPPTIDEAFTKLSLLAEAARELRRG